VSYYMGDYRGDFYPMGDPGIGSFFRKAFGFATSFIPGVGGAVSKAISRIPGGRPAAAAITSAARATGTAIVKHPVLSAAGAAGALAGGEALMGRGSPAGAGMGLHRPGYHMAMRGKKKGMMVRNRRMNVANGRALNRAVRRLHAFARRYRKVVGFVSPRKPKGRMYFRKRRHARAA
jgi:hypothetical protein